MRKAVALLTLGLLFFAALPVGADDPPVLDFVRALRTNNFGDLALDYLDRLQADKGTSPDIRAVIALERGRVRLEQANNEFNATRRNNFYALARKEFDDFVKSAKPDNPYIAEAKFEAARILALQGRSQVARAARLTDDGAAAGEFQKAHDVLLQAGRELKAAYDLLDSTLQTKNPPPKVAAALAQAKLQCQLDMAVAQVDRASTYEAQNKNLEDRGNLIKGAIGDLRKLHAVDPKNPVCWLAKAWAGRAFLEVDQPKEAETELKAVLSENAPYADAARRLAKFFTFVDYVDPRKRKPADVIAKAGDEWLRDYGGFANSYEGMLVRFETAKAYEVMGRTLVKDPKAALDPVAKAHLEKAEALYNALDEVPNDFTEEAGQRRFSISMIKLGNIDVTNVATIVTFSAGYDAMQALAIKLGKTENPNERKTVLSKILEVLTRTVAVADSKAPEAKLAEVKSNMAWVHMALGDPMKAVVLGENLARSMAHQPKAAAGGAYALQAYSQMINDPAAEARWKQGDLDRMLAMAQFMEKTWPTDVNTDAARHQVGTLMLREKNAKAAAAVLGRVSDNYRPAAALADARWWWSVAAQQMLAEPNLTAKEKKAYQDQSVKALESFPQVGNDAPGDVAQMFVQAQLQLGQVLYESKKYDQLEGLAKTLQTRLPKFKNLDAGFRKDLERTVEALVYYSQYGRGTTELNAGKVAEARKIVDPVLQKVTAQVKELRKDEADARKALDLAVAKANADRNNEKLQDAAEEAKERHDRVSRGVGRDAQLQRALMVIAMRAAILDDNTARAQQLLTGLQEAASDSAVGPAIYIQIVQEMHKQISDLKTQKDKAKLDKVTKSFGNFLDQLASKPMTPEIIFFLANAYSSLDKHGDAGKLLAKIPPPAANDPNKDKADNIYRAAQLMALKELRLGKEYKAAETKMIEIMKTEWGPRSHQVQEEKARLFEDQVKWGGAAVAWKDLMAILQPRVTKEPKIKEQYYEAYYSYIYCLYKYALTLEDAKKKGDYIKRAAQLMIKLEEIQPDFGGEGMKDKYMQLLKDEAVLKKEYDAIKAANNAAAANNAKDAK